jgi:type I restriction enzyme S subunit
VTISLSKLHEQAEIVMGQSPPGSSYNTDGLGLPLLNGPTEFGPVHPLERQWTTAPTKICKPGDILFCVRGATAGRINVADKEYCLGRGLAAVRARPDRFENRFLQYVLSAGYARFQHQGVGSTFINISNEMLSNFDVPLMGLDEQRRVAAILDQADDLRRKRKEVLIRLQSVKRAIFLEMFGNPLTNVRKWHVQKLDEICIGITDIDHKMPKSVEAGIPFISAKDLVDGGISFTDVKMISKEDFMQLAKKGQPRVGDIIYSRIGARLGKARIVIVDFDFLASYSCCTIKPNKQVVNEIFLCELLDSPWTRKQAHRGVRAIGVPDLGLAEIKNFKIILPPMELQITFAERISTVTVLKDCNVQSANMLSKLYRLLQHRAFRGEL